MPAEVDKSANQRAAAGEYFLVYQPNIDLETGAFAGVEALIRWRDPTHGVRGPDEFISDLEASGEIVAVGRWALVVACTDAATWHDKGYRFNVSVNISPKQFVRDEFVDDVARAVDLSRFDSSLLVLEFALSTLTAERSTTTKRLAALRDLDVRIAVDDFDPGSDEFHELQEFEIDIVKLRRDFVASLGTSRDATTLVHSLVQLSESRHIQVIAAGIEDSDQRATLRSERVQVGQGFLFSHPYGAAEIDTYLEDFSIFSGKPL